MNHLGLSLCVRSGVEELRSSEAARPDQGERTPEMARILGGSSGRLASSGATRSFVSVAPSGSFPAPVASLPALESSARHSNPFRFQRIVAWMATSIIARRSRD